MTKKEHRQNLLNDVLINRLEHFTQMEPKTPEYLAKQYNEGYSSQSKRNSISHISIRVNNKRKYLFDEDYIKEVKKIDRNATQFNDRAITKFLENRNYIKINVNNIYMFLYRDVLKETIKKYNLCQ